MRRTCWILPPLLLNACGGDARLAPSRTLRVALEDTPRTLDPRFATDAHGQRTSRHLLYNSLVQHGYNLEHIPDPQKVPAPLNRQPHLWLAPERVFPGGNPAPGSKHELAVSLP